MTQTDHSLDIAMLVGFAFAAVGFYFSQIWWIFGGTLLIWMGVISKPPDDHPELEDEPMVIDWCLIRKQFIIQIAIHLPMAVKNGKTIVLAVRMDQETAGRFRTFVKANNFSQNEAMRVLLALWPSKGGAE